MKAKITLFVVVAMSALIMSASLPSGRRINIEARRFKFTPNEITIKRGEKVVLVFTSKDVTHGLEIAELGMHTEIPKGQTTEVPLLPETAGTYVGKCAHFCGAGHGDMQLKVHVR